MGILSQNDGIPSVHQKDNHHPFLTGQRTLFKETKGNQPGLCVGCRLKNEANIKCHFPLRVEQS
ncbi:MAG: hypothetical protein HWD58_18175 [Bacteroidota bacterium]|nr:MAG: hypothetical protein HWD58_18175 [Bacteroidota bacterium]